MAGNSSGAQVKNKGFGFMDDEKKGEMAKKEGKIEHQKEAPHQFDTEEAQTRENLRVASKAEHDQNSKRSNFTKEQEDGGEERNLNE